MRTFLPFEFMDWNTYINKERANKYQANAIKQEEKRIVALLVREIYKGDYPVTLIFRPHFKNKRRDLDNVRLKGLIDGLVSAGVIKNDNLTCINKIVVEAVFDDKEGIELEIERTEDGRA